MPSPEPRLEDVSRRRASRPRRSDRFCQLLGGSGRQSQPGHQSSQLSRQGDAIVAGPGRRPSPASPPSAPGTAPEVLGLGRVAHAVVTLRGVARLCIPDQMALGRDQSALLAALGSDLLEHGPRLGVRRRGTRQIRNERPPDESFVFAAAGQIQQRGRDIDVPGGSADPARRQAGNAHDERHLRLSGVEVEPVFGDAVLTETFPVIAGEDDGRAIPQAGGPQGSDQPREVKIRETNLAVVPIHAR